MSTIHYFLAFVIGAVLAGVGLVGYEWSSSPDTQPIDVATEEVVMYQNPQCSCCTKWADHLVDNGFEVTIEPTEVDQLDSLRQAQGVPVRARSCHTAVVGDYVVEGHVPADDIKQLLHDRPNIVGISVPGMPVGSPGMEGAYEEPYDVLAFDDDGQLYIFSEHRP